LNHSRCKENHSHYDRWDKTRLFSE